MIQEGSVVFLEIGKRVQAGPIFGEVGLFAPEGKRALTAVCEVDCRLSMITKDKTLKLY